jgi:hypothetical protein
MRERLYLRLALAITLAIQLSACGVEETPPSIDTGTVDSDTYDAVESDVSVTDVMNDTLEVSLLDIEIDSLQSDVLDVFDAIDVVDSFIEDVGPIDTGPPPLVAAPDWFYQTKIEGLTTDEKGESEQFIVDLPDETTSIFLQVESEEDYAFYTLKTVVTPPMILISR